MPATSMTIYKTLAGVVVLLPLLTLYDSTLVHSSDFEALRKVVLENRTDRLEEKVEELENDIALLESRPSLEQYEKQALIKMKNRREKYLRKLDRE